MTTPLRLVCLSDTHGQHGRFDELKGFKIPDGDLLIHSGDMTKFGTAPELREFNEWLGTLPHPHKIVVAGNHDEAFEYEPERARALLTNAVYLQDSETTAAGLRIWGSPWQPEFNEWHFNLPRGAELKAKWDLIPQGIDVLVTHGPPRGMLDQVPSGERVGCSDLLNAVERVRPRLHVFGHIHTTQDDGSEPKPRPIRQITSGGTIFANAASLNDAYRMARPPLVIELARSTGTSQ